MIPEVIAHYRIISKIGEGGMGVVYRAEDEDCHRPVAIKLISSAYVKDPMALKRFAREVQITSSLHHPHICTVYECGEASTINPTIPPEFDQIVKKALKKERTERYSTARELKRDLIRLQLGEFPCIYRAQGLDLRQRNGTFALARMHFADARIEQASAYSASSHGRDFTGGCRPYE